MDYITTQTILSPIRRGFDPGFVNYKKGCTRFAAVSDKAYQLLVHSQWFYPGTLASSTTQTGHHDILIAEIYLKVALNTINQIKSFLSDLLIVSESGISVTSSADLIVIQPGNYIHVTMEVKPSKPPFTGYWTRRGLDGIETTIVNDNSKYMYKDSNSILIVDIDANDVGFYTLYVTNGVDSGHNEPPVILQFFGTYYSNLDIYGISVLQMFPDMFHL